MAGAQIDPGQNRSLALPTTGAQHIAASLLAAAAGIATAALLALLYVPTALDLWRVWSIDLNYSHGPLVPLFSLALAVWIARQPETSWPSEVSKAEVQQGTVRCLLGFVLHVVALFVGSLLMDVVALIFLLLGMLVICGGNSTRKAYGFPVLFLLFMAPLPVAWYQPVAVVLQQIVSTVSAHLLNLVGVPAYQSGYMISLPDLTLEVGEACSGLRQLTAVLALGTAIGFLSGRGFGYRWILALAALPIAVFTNCLRVVLTGVVSEFFGHQFGEGFFHQLEGLALVVVSAGMIYALAVAMAAWADRLQPRTSVTP